MFIFLFPTCSSLLLQEMKGIAPSHSPVFSAAREHACMCHIHSPPFNNSSALLCILQRASLYCQPPRQRQKERKKKNLLVSLDPPITPVSDRSFSTRPQLFLSTSHSYSANPGHPHWTLHSPGYCPPCPPRARVSVAASAEPIVPVTDEAVLQCQH